MRHLTNSIGIAAVLALSACGSASAENPLCDREIEGVTVKMSIEEARLIWLARGYVEITEQNPREMRGIASGAIQRVDFADRLPQVNEGYRPERVTLSLYATELEVNLTKLFHDEGGSISREVIAEFCPNGGPSRTAPVFCADVSNGQPGMRLNITVQSEDNLAAGRCTYSFGGPGLINETVRLNLEAEPAPRPQAQGFKG